MIYSLSKICSKDYLPKTAMGAAKKHDHDEEGVIKIISYISLARSIPENRKTLGRSFLAFRMCKVFPGSRMGIFFSKLRPCGFLLGFPQDIYHTIEKFVR